MTLLILAYLGGVLTILSPCILPVLPFVFARAGQSFTRSALPMLAGMAITFALVAMLVTVGGSWAVHANQYGRYVALLEAISKTAEKKLNRTLPINATGAIGAILSELGFPWRICRGVAIIGRAVGLVGHIAEEMRNPLGREMWERIEEEVFENRG